MRYIRISTLVLFACCSSCKNQRTSEQTKDNVKPSTKEAVTTGAPADIVRNVAQDKNGDIWLASWQGVFRYDGKSFINMTKGISSARFFSVFEDSKGYVWCGSIGSGVYQYNGYSFRNFTTTEGLYNNEVGCIYEDRSGNIWFGVNGGASRYDGKSFRNYMIEGNTLVEDKTGKKFFPNMQRPPMEVNAIIEDKTGRLWLATRGNTFVYDGQAFAVVAHDNKPFANVRTMIEDKKGNLWLGGSEGLWRYEGNLFRNITENFVAYLYEDRNGTSGPVRLQAPTHKSAC